MTANPDPAHLDGRQARFELKTLLDTSRLLIESSDPDFVMHNLLLIAMGKVLCGRAAIVLFDSERGRYEVCKTKGRTGYADGQVVGSPIGRNYYRVCLKSERNPGTWGISCSDPRPMGSPTIRTRWIFWRIWSICRRSPSPTPCWFAS
jgi:hypothetical protein